MIFQANIDNDSVALLPAARFPGRVVVVDSDDMVDAACDDLQRFERIGFDTETRPSFRAGVSYKVSLLQLSTPDVCYLFRLCKIRLSNRILKILGSRRILKVGADVSGDIRQLRELRDFSADGFVDLQLEASRWGIEEKSLRKLSAIVLGERVSKAQRLSNWEATVLTDQQRDYAATDAWVSLKLLDELLKVKPVIDAPLTIVGAPQPKSVKPKFGKAKEGEAKGDKQKPRNRHRRFVPKKIKENKENKRA
ncbi:MAG: 3'-5' exonuclease domain-containing protein 2 [Alistipes sp.]|nr:3'-5' exonuclease domain-containing protein 2 [Alistipes sp.]